MAENSKIEWTHHTFNPWWGCQRVSPGCVNCYAETLSHRYGHHVWGPAKTTGRRTFGEQHWAEPLKWNAAAARDGKRARVFCSSMADVFEEHPAVDAEREKLWPLIERTPWLDWLLLTKRPENITSMIPIPWRFHGGEPANVWYGTSVESQEWADARIPELLKVPAKVRFLSCEPLVGPVDLSRWLTPCPACGAPYSDSISCTYCETWPDVRGIDWVIAGGESGHTERYCDPAWVRSLRDQCQDAGAAFFFKQWGEWAPASQAPPGLEAPPIGPRSRRQSAAFAEMFGPATDSYWRVGKPRAGRLLDGREWNEFPKSL